MSAIDDSLLVMRPSGGGKAVPEVMFLVLSWPLAFTGFITSPAVQSQRGQQPAAGFQGAVGETTYGILNLGTLIA